MPVLLDSRAARPLSNREISKLLCAMLNGIAAIEPATTIEFHELIGLSRALLDAKLSSGGGGDILRRICKGEERATWRLAFGATVGGLAQWCDRDDIETALLWVDEHLPRMFRNTLN